MTEFDRQVQGQSKTQQRSGTSSGTSSKSSISPALLAVGGGLVAAAAIVGVMLSSGNQPVGTAERPALTLVKAGEVEKAAGTIAPEQKDKLVEEAKACRAPLAQMRISKTDAGGRGVIRIRAGNYLSPAFTVGDAPINVAVPFPAPYQTGKGEIVLEGAAKGVFVEMTPGVTLTDESSTSKTVPVWWQTDKPCGG